MVFPDLLHRSREQMLYLIRRDITGVDVALNLVDAIAIDDEHASGDAERAGASVFANLPVAHEQGFALDAAAEQIEMAGAQVVGIIRRTKLVRNAKLVLNGDCAATYCERAITTVLVSTADVEPCAVQCAAVKFAGVHSTIHAEHETLAECTASCIENNMGFVDVECRTRGIVVRDYFTIPVFWIGIHGVATGPGKRIVGFSFRSFFKGGAGTAVVRFLHVIS